MIVVDTPLGLAELISYENTTDLVPEPHSWFFQPKPRPIVCYVRALADGRLASFPMSDCSKPRVDNTSTGNESEKLGHKETCQYALKTAHSDGYLFASCDCIVTADGICDGSWPNLRYRSKFNYCPECGGKLQ